MELYSFISKLGVSVRNKKKVVVQKQFPRLLEILEILWNEKAILGYNIKNNNTVLIYLKFDLVGNSTIKDIVLKSKPGKRIYLTKKKINKNNNINIYSTSVGGILSLKPTSDVGGEFICSICL